MEQGLLDLSVELSTNTITAGREFALFVLVKNPFAGPVWIREVNVSLPSDLKLADEDRFLAELHQSKQAREKESQELARSRARLEQKLAQVREELRELKDHVQSSGIEIGDVEPLGRKLEAQAESLETELRKVGMGGASVHIYGSSIDTIEIGSEFTDLVVRSDNEVESRIRVIKVLNPNLLFEQSGRARIIKLRSSLPDNMALQSGSTAVFTAVLNVKKSLIFTPAQYRLQFYVIYSFEPLPNDERDGENRQTLLTNTIAHLLTIRPSVYSILVGSALGGGVGAMMRLLQLSALATLHEVIATVIASIVLGGIAVVFMARKSDTQSFVSIEDFWGGLLIGFLVGYTGTSFFETLTGVTPEAVDLP